MFPLLRACLFVLFGNILISAVTQAQTIYRDIYLRESAGQWLFGNQKLELALDQKSGAWLSLKKAGVPDPLVRAGALAETFDLKVNDDWLIEKHGATLLRHAVQVNKLDSSVTLQLVFGVQPVAGAKATYAYEVTCQYILKSEHAQLKRTASLVHQTRAGGPANPKFYGFMFKLPQVVIGSAADCVFDAPGPFFPKTFVAPATPLAELAGKNIRFHSAPDAGLGLLAVSNKQLQTTLAAWMETKGEVAYFPALQSNGGPVSLSFHNDRTYRLAPQAKITSDPQHLEVANSLPAALAAYRRMSAAQMPLDQQTPAAIREMVLLEIYPEYFPTGFKGITQKLPFYKQVGFNTIYLMPHWLGGYSPLDFYTVDPKFGTPADLQELVQTAHALGMKVLFDMVIHGFNEKSPVVKQRPELFVRDEKGNLALHPTWKSVTTDWASPVYQQYMADLALHDAKTYGIDGYRLDAATYKGPNWDQGLKYPAYRSGAAAPELMERMLQAMHTVNPNAVMLSEVFGPVFYTVSNLVHDNQTEGPQFLLEKMAKGEYTAQAYKRHMQNVLQALPAGANRVYFARNHDTSWFYHFNGYTPAFMALEAVHALCAIPEVFAGDPKNQPNPDDDPAVFARYRQLFSLRQDFPELARGELLLAEVDANNPMVFTALRRLNGKLTLVAVSLSGKTESVKISLPENILPAFTSDFKLIDGLTKTPVKTQNRPREITLIAQPYQVIVGRL